MSHNDSIPPGFLAGLEPLSRRRFLASGIRATATVGALLALPGRLLAVDEAPVAKGGPAGARHLTDLEYRVFDKLRVVMLPTQKYDLPSTVEIPVMRTWLLRSSRAFLTFSVGLIFDPTLRKTLAI